MWMILDLASEMRRDGGKDVRDWVSALDHRVSCYQFRFHQRISIFGVKGSISP
jgi:hypothetical protein